MLHYKDFETYFAEFAASFIFATTLFFSAVANVSQPAIPYAFCKMMIGFAFEELTIKHANPAITFSCACIGLFSLRSALAYMLCQTVGYLAAGGITILLYGSTAFYKVYEKTKPVKETSGIELLLLETIVSIILSVVIIENVIYAKGLYINSTNTNNTNNTNYNINLYNNTNSNTNYTNYNTNSNKYYNNNVYNYNYNYLYTTQRYRRNKYMVSFTIGAITGVGSIIASASEGGSFNVAYILAVYIYSNRYSRIWAYIVGDFIGSIIAGIIVRYML
ncbi:hypothetical protein EHP00_2037 [Ecytonucleospora hepatopenaei]|uniref:Aquaporin n=1 Tax=Ecytonucleospora hepatopenaei TaxID=646526 RepID=A0A1W0E474_9MICR|nr:hypothetical protein EHP00_2037 [Ecytonucleospora hepatopenaei]